MSHADTIADRRTKTAIDTRRCVRSRRDRGIKHRTRGGDLPHNGIGWRAAALPRSAPNHPKELAAGAIGVTYAKLGEAEVLAAMGIRDILIANQILGPAKMRRLVDLLAIADPIVGNDRPRMSTNSARSLHNAAHCAS